MRVKTTAPMDNVKSLLINDRKMKALGNELQILITTWATQSNGFWHAHTLSCRGVAALQIAWICKKLLTFWRVLVILTSYVPGKLTRVWSYYRQFRNYLKITKSQIRGIKRILRRNSDYIKNIWFWYEFSCWVETLPIFSTLAESLIFIR